MSVTKQMADNSFENTYTMNQNLINSYGGIENLPNRSNNQGYAPKNQRIDTNHYDTDDNEDNGIVNWKTIGKTQVDKSFMNKIVPAGEHAGGDNAEIQIDSSRHFPTVDARPLPNNKIAFLKNKINEGLKPRKPRTPMNQFPCNAG